MPKPADAIRWLRRYWPFPLVFLLLLALSLHFRFYSMDEYTYMNAADALAQHNPSLVLQGESGRFYAFPFFVAQLLPYWNDVELASKFLNLLFYALTVLLVHQFARKLYDEKAAFWAALFTATSPLLIFLGTRVLTEPLFDFLFVLSVYALFQFARKPSYPHAFYLGLVPALLVLTRFIGLYFFPLALLYLAHQKKLRLLAVPQALFAAAVFLLVSALFILGQPGAGSNPADHILQFVENQINVRQGDLSLPDRIPSYLLLLPFAAGLALPWLMALSKKPRQLMEQNYLLPLLAILVVAVSMELYGFFNYRLLRYLAPALPFAFMLAGAAVEQLPKYRKWAFAAVVLSLLLALALTAGIYLKYEKHVAYAQAGQYAAAHCNAPDPQTGQLPAIFSNVPAAVIHFVKRPVLYGLDADRGTLPSRVDCLVKSSYDAWTFDAQFPPSQYLPIFSSGGVQVLHPL